MERPENPTCAELFLTFAKASATGFGGVLPFARRMIVEEKRWLSEEEFADLFAFCQFIPGANVVNLAICIGARYRGPMGAIAGALGMLVPPMLVILLLGAFYVQFGDLPLAKGVMRGLGAAAAGLVVSVALRLGLTFRAKASYLFAALAFGAIALWRIPLITMLAVLAPASIGWQWVVRRK
ncbi:MAG: chromate transport protein ChrA [Betaproteobacteria bacterium]|nr:chromate transport protein ChrA [Betaproteobacteria bacterium]